MLEWNVCSYASLIFLTETHRRFIVTILFFQQGRVYNSLISVGRSIDALERPEGEIVAAAAAAAALCFFYFFIAL